MPERKDWEIETTSHSVSSRMACSRLALQTRPYDVVPPRDYVGADAFANHEPLPMTGSLTSLRLNPAV
jgi:hypothetical protein